LSKVAGREERSRAKRRSLEVREEISRQELWESAGADGCLRLAGELQMFVCVRTRLGTCTI
jgi:hypothetical protein